MRIYLSGPMSGYPHMNYPRFNEVAAKLRLMGHVVYNPAEFQHEGKFPIREAFSEYAAFITNRADALVMLEGWQKSLGATCEYLLARNCGVTVYRWQDEPQTIIAILEALISINK